MAIPLLVATVVVLGALLLFTALTGFFYLTRGTPIERVRLLGGEGPIAMSDPLFLPTVETLVGTDLMGGNRIEVLFDGDGTFPPLWEALESARELITWHVFWLEPGRVADRLGEILSERARAGVEVLVLKDYFGAKGEWGGYWEELRDAGVRVETFRPLRWNTLYKFQQRTHARTVIVDGRVGFTGGFGIDDRWRGGGRAPGEWRDTSVRLEGPVVSRLQGAFAADWAEATGELIQGRRAFPPDPGGGRRREGDGGSRKAGAAAGGAAVEGASREGVVAGIVDSAPSVGSTVVERLHVLTITGARETLYFTSAYFVPGEGFRTLLREAVERGVEVRILTPGANTDRPSTWYASRAHYEELLEGGVRIYEYRPTMVHAKTVVADGMWCSIGSMNFDNRSMALNDEVTLLVRDAAVAGLLHRRFLEDLEHADELRLETFRRRGPFEKAKERFYFLFSRLL